VPAEEARPGSLPAEIEAVEKRAAMMTYALKPEIGEPDHLLVNAALKTNAVGQKTYRSAVFVNVTSSRSRLVSCVNQILPSLPKVRRRLS